MSCEIKGKRKIHDAKLAHALQKAQRDAAPGSSNPTEIYSGPPAGKGKSRGNTAERLPESGMNGVNEVLYATFHLLHVVLKLV